MEVVAQMKETEIQEILFPTMLAFVPLLESKREEITQARKTFKYGETDRHQLDVYYPPTSEGKPPILIYVYGGGFVSGGRTLPTPIDLAYGNLGLYFAKRGFVTIIPDYRLAPGTTFPGPAEDLRDALSWAVANLREDADIDSIFFLGHSAGGVHTLTLLLEPSILASAPSLRIKGVAISSAPFHFGPSGIEVIGREPVNMYYGSPEETQAKNPLALLNAASPELIKALPPLALIRCERDPAWFKVVGQDFNVALAEKGVTPVQILAEAHNHISVSLALSTGEGEKQAEGEQWAAETAAWMNRLTASSTGT
ncbi:Alpha/Beta hydrolase protein [Mycena maculata]|uniref:Alpha/Beta hydrolase protein n=1 Tax=Mycena maculata TaxID=230809 RepID=A0AAD7NQA4_9AGAR|nr:Alpha/Beta hydrolase protein [Mycena maculata]